jgi:DNA-binding FadR family transcriptional regulator
MRDRSDGDTLLLTQNLLAEMLRVHRPSITNAIQQLTHRRLISISRGSLHILDRQGLIEASCECYELVRMRTAFHLPKTYP